MSLTKKTIIIASVAASIVVLFLVGIGIGVLVNISNRPAIFTRCDGSPEPMGDIKISSCPHSHSAGYCKIVNDEVTELEFTFNPAIDYTEAQLSVSGLLDHSTSLQACRYGLDCPSAEGLSQTLIHMIPSGIFLKGQSGKVSFSLVDPSKSSNNLIFCVEFPAEIV